MPSKEKYQQYVDEIFESGWVTNNGKLVRELECRLAEYLGVKNIALVANIEFLLSIKHRILKSQYEALKSVNKELITLYWDIGKQIVQKQDELGWGKAIVKTLAEDLQKEFTGVKGFSERNLWNMRTFYTTYANNIKLQTLSREIAWSHNIAIIQN